MLRQDFLRLGVKQLCGLFGKTRHAYYDKCWRGEKQSIEQAIVLELVAEARKDMPRLGTDKVYHLIRPALQKHKIKIGRDGLHDLLADYGLTIRRRRRRTLTTNSNHNYRKYPNLIRELFITAPEQLWVCDITYISLKHEFNYLSLITDAYSRKIIAHCLSTSLDNKGCIEALNMALESRTTNRQLIHHSDRGIQYCSQQYVDFLLEADILISMTENGDPYENAKAERMNGILKTELGLAEEFQDHEQARQAVMNSVRIYNEKRPHASCNFLTPAEAHKQSGELQRRWKHYRPKPAPVISFEHINTY